MDILNLVCIGRIQIFGDLSLYSRTLSTNNNQDAVNTLVNKLLRSNTDLLLSSLIPCGTCLSQKRFQSDKISHYVTLFMQ